MKKGMRVKFFGEGAKIISEKVGGFMIVMEKDLRTMFAAKNELVIHEVQ